jgi:lipid A 3-O-deacylase
MSLKSLALATASLLALAPAAYAQDYLTGGVAYFDINDDADAAALNVEYRGDYVFYDMVRPIVGAFVTNEGGAYAYAGVNWDIPVVDNRFYVIPGFAVGAYTQGDEDDGKDLGGALEFRSSIELAYQLDDASRLGLSISHLSNASLYDDNPGTELVTATYSLPLNW